MILYGLMDLNNKNITVEVDTTQLEQMPAQVSTDVSAMVEKQDTMTNFVEGRVSSVLSVVNYNTSCNNGSFTQISTELSTIKQELLGLTDPNLLPENIKNGVTIMGVTGTYIG